MTGKEQRMSSLGRVMIGASIAALCSLALTVAVVSGNRTAEAHGNPEVRVEPESAMSGEDVTIEGEGFEEDSEVSLTLEGVLGEISLGSVTTDSEGAFSLAASLPAAVAPGSYKVRVVGADDVATADLHIEPAEGGETARAAHEFGIDFHRVDSEFEIAGFATLAGVLVLIGALLLWLPAKEGQV